MSEAAFGAKAPFHVPARRVRMRPRAGRPRDAHVPKLRGDPAASRMHLRNDMRPTRKRRLAMHHRNVRAAAADTE
jgi:hypothetical protein